MSFYTLLSWNINKGTLFDMTVVAQIDIDTDVRYSGIIVYTDLIIDAKSLYAVGIDFLNG